MKAQAERRAGFTIVELLIVIVVIAILAAITVVAYRGITDRAIDSTLKQDISSANKQVEIYRATNGSLPQSNNCPSPGQDEVCLEGSEGTTFTYVTNGTTPPTSYQILATNSDRSAVSYDGSPAESSYGGRFVTLTNLVQNGDFSSGSTSWTGSSYCNGATQCIYNGENLTIIADPSGASRVMQYISTSYSDQDKIFYSARARKDSGSNFTMEAHRTSGGYSTMILTGSVFDSAPTGQLVRYSAVRTYHTSQGATTGFRAGSSGAGRTFQATVDDVVVVNLTSTFGAGNEPSAVEMEDILSQFENGYFSGTVNATY